MKKVLISLAAVALLACLASCNKTCNCKIYLNGEMSREYEQELDQEHFNKCSDMNTVVEVGGKKSGIECKSQLF